MKIFLIRMGDYSSYIRSLIDRDRAEKHEKAYIDRRRRELKAQLAELDEVEKTKAEAPSRGREILAKWLNVWKQDVRTVEGKWDDNSVYAWIRTRVVPELKRAGVEMTPAQILDKFQGGRIE